MTAPVLTRTRPVLESWTDQIDGLVRYRFELPAAPRSKKTSNRLLKFGKHVKVVPSKAWIAWRDECRAYVATKPALHLHLERSLNCAAVFYRDANRGDMAGYIAGVADVLEEIGIVTNDKHLVQFDGCRLMVDHDRPRTRVTLTVLAQEGTDA